MTHTPIEMLSIDVSNYCSKQCPFCYNHSSRQGLVEWQPGELVRFASDCVRHGVKAVSLGGGEPFEYEGLFEVIEALYPLCYLSVTSNGLPLLRPEMQNRLKLAHPDKIHLTIHHPDHADEVNRCLQQTELIRSLGIKPGINLMVGADSVEAARNAYRQLTRTLDADQIILVPQRFGNTPSAKALGLVAGGRRSKVRRACCRAMCRRISPPSHGTRRPDAAVSPKARPHSPHSTSPASRQPWLKRKAHSIVVSKRRNEFIVKQKWVQGFGHPA